MNQSPTVIGIAVVEQGERFLVGVRAEGLVLAGKAEFPGGKCRPGEPPVDAAVRECLEETGLRVTAVELLAATTHDYPHGRVQLEFWRCRPLDPRDMREAHQGFRWVAARELESLDFPEANAAVVRRLTDGAA